MCRARLVAFVLLSYVLFAPVGAANAEDGAPPAAVRDLLRKVADGKPGERLKAVEVLGKMKAEAGHSVRSLLKLLLDSDFDVRAAAARAIENLAEAALPALVKDLKSTELPRRIDAAWAIHDLNKVMTEREVRGWAKKFQVVYQKEVSPRLLAALDHRDEDWR